MEGEFSFGGDYEEAKIRELESNGRVGVISAVDMAGLLATVAMKAEEIASHVQGGTTGGGVFDRPCCWLSIDRSGSQLRRANSSGGKECSGREIWRRNGR